MYDSIIIGAGPAGLTAAIYLLRDNKNIVIFEKSNLGGQIATSSCVENYPGYESISGTELINHMVNQIDDLNGTIKFEEAIKIFNEDDYKVVKTIKGEYKTKSIIIASGLQYKKLNIDNEDKYLGKNIHFCVTCDGRKYKNKVVAVIGGGNSGVTNAISLSKIASKVYLIQDLDYLTCDNVLKDRIKNISTIEILYNSKVIKYLGDSQLLSIKLNNQEIKVDGVFMSTGMIPNNEFINNVVDMEDGYVISDNTTTNDPGIFVVGDARTKEYNQLTIATSDGTIAALNVIKYLK